MPMSELDRVNSTNPFDVSNAWHDQHNAEHGLATDDDVAQSMSGPRPLLYCGACRTNLLAIPRNPFDRAATLDKTDMRLWRCPDCMGLVSPMRFSAPTRWGQVSNDDARSLEEYVHRNLEMVYCGECVRPLEKDEYSIISMPGGEVVAACRRHRLPAIIADRAKINEALQLMYEGATPAQAPDTEDRDKRIAELEEQVRSLHHQLKLVGLNPTPSARRAARSASI